MWIIRPKGWWGSVSLEIQPENCRLFAGISKSTGMDPHDIAATLQILNMVQKRDGKWVIGIC